MTDEPMTPYEAACKVEWEGGVIEALDYGLRAADIAPSQLRDAWLRIEAHWPDFDHVQRLVRQELDQDEEVDQ